MSTNSLEIVGRRRELTGRDCGFAATERGYRRRNRSRISPREFSNSSGSRRRTISCSSRSPRSKPSEAERRQELAALLRGPGGKRRCGDRLSSLREAPPAACTAMPCSDGGDEAGERGRVGARRKLAFHLRALQTLADHLLIRSAPCRQFISDTLGMIARAGDPLHEEATRRARFVGQRLGRLAQQSRDPILRLWPASALAMTPSCLSI